MDRKVLIAYGALIAASLLIALAAVIWLGWNGRLSNVPGDVGLAETSPSAWMLLLPPALLVPAGLIALLGLKWAWLGWPTRDRLSADSQRGIDRYESALRRFFIGIGILIAMVQVLVVLRTAGLAMPVDFDMRAFYFGFGLLLAGVGNVVPKLPLRFDRWLDPASYLKVNRSNGWIVTLGGAAFCLSAILAPAESLKPVTQIVIYAVIGLPVLNILIRGCFRRGRHSV